MAAGSIVIDMLLKTGSFITDSLRAEKRVKDMGSSFDRVGKTLGNVFSGIAVGTFIRSVVNATVEQERVTKQLEATLKSTGGQAGLTRDELLSMASGLQDVTTYGDEATVAAQALLLTFTNIGKNTFPQALEAVLNVSTAMGTDLKSAALQVGKALNDPIKGMTSLADSGIQFSEAQKELIKTLVATGQGVEAQKIILKELDVQFGGSARAARDTMGGALKSLQNAFGDLLEGDGGGEGVRGATASINDLATLMSSSTVKSAFGTITTAVLDLLNLTARAAVVFADFGKAIGEALGAAVAGPDTAVGQIDQEIAGLQERLGLLADDLSRVRLLRVNPFQSTAEMQQDYDNVLERLRTLRTLRESINDVKPAGAPAAPGAENTTPDRPFGSPPKPTKTGTGSGAPKVTDLQRLSKAFADQAATIGLTSEQVELYRYKLAGASPRQLAFAASVQDSISAFEAQAKALADGQSVMESVRTPAETYAAEIERLNDLLERGAVSQETYSRAVFEAQDAFSDTQESVQAMRADLEALNVMLNATPSAQLEKTRADMFLLRDAFVAGRISAEEYTEAVQTRLGTLPDTIEAATDSMSAFTDQAARNMQSAFADFLFDPFKDGVEGMAKAFGNILQRMAAEAAAAQLFDALGSWGKSNSGSGGWLGAIASIAGAFGGARATGGPVASGMTYLVGERGPELFRPGTSGAIVPNDQLRGSMRSGGSTVINVTVQGGSAPDVRRAAGQGAREALSAYGGAQRYA